MVSSQVQTPVNKNSPEFVDKATQILNLIASHVEAECPHCLSLISKSKGLRPETPEPEQTTTTLQEPPRSDNHV